MGNQSKRGPKRLPTPKSADVTPLPVPPQAGEIQIDAGRVIVKLKDRLSNAEVDLAVKDAYIEQILEERAQMQRLLEDLGGRVAQLETTTDA